jgi:serine/threonine protein phosphatase PrpC
MQAEANIVERIAQVYVARRSMRLLAALAVLSAAMLLFVLAGGFPPFAWRLLAQTLPHISILLAVRGQAALVALVGLVLLSLTILFAWGTLLWLSWRMLAYWRYERQELRRLAADVAKAQYLAEDEQEEYATQHSEADAFEDEYAYAGAIAGAGYRYIPMQRRQGYPLASLAPDTRDEEELYQDDEYAEDEADFSQDEEYAEDENDTVAGFYQAEDDDEVPWTDQGATTVSVPAQQPPVSLARPPVYDRPIIEHAAPSTPPDGIQQTDYGWMMPAVPTAPVERSPRLKTMLYDHALLPTTPLPTTPLSTVPLPTTPLPTTMPEPGARPPTIQLIVSTELDVGLKRRDKPNEDSLLALQNTRVLHGCTCPVGLFAVADGMGGHDRGLEASRLVIQSLSKSVVPSVIYGPTDDNYAELLAEGVHRANLEIYQRNRQEKADMGTTLAAALVVGTTAYVVNVGDSRVYLYRASSGLTQVTRDHSTVARLVEGGMIKPDEVYTHPRRNEIYRSLGHHSNVDLDKFILALQPDDLLLLCSDGLWEMVRDAEIQEIIASTLPQLNQTSAALVQAALDGGGNDNISVIVVYVKAIEGI